MVRAGTPLGPTQRSSPHTRGDGPIYRYREFRRWRFSPHAWGWSAHQVGHRLRRSVLPTRVGMVRSEKRNGFVAQGSPHTRGDGPPSVLVGTTPRKFSPHAWG